MDRRKLDGRRRKLAVFCDNGRIIPPGNGRVEQICMTGVIDWAVDAEEFRIDDNLRAVAKLRWNTAAPVPGKDDQYLSQLLRTRFNGLRFFVTRLFATRKYKSRFLQETSGIAR
jgi:hypothetical protein